MQMSDDNNSRPAHRADGHDMVARLKRGFIATANEMTLPPDWEVGNPPIGYE